MIASTHHLNAIYYKIIKTIWLYVEAVWKVWKNFCAKYSL